MNRKYEVPALTKQRALAKTFANAISIFDNVSRLSVSYHFSTASMLEHVHLTAPPV